jgi:hypothetical protein
MSNLAIEPIQRDPTEVDVLESRVRTVPNLLGRQTLWSVVSQPGSAFFVVRDTETDDEVGLLGVVNIKQGYFGEAHITFWDGKLNGKAAVCRDAARLVMESCSLHFLLTYIPEDLRAVIGFARKVGFIPLERRPGVETLVLFRKEPEKWE